MRCISISSISKEALKDVHQIYARLESGAIAAVATKPPIPKVLDRPGRTVPASVSIQLTRDDGSPFSDIDEARKALQEKPTRIVLSDIEFTTNSSINAAKFIEAYANLLGENHHDPIDRNTVNQIAWSVNLNTEELESVLIELDDRNIHVHDGGMISLIPPPIL